MIGLLLENGEVHDVKLVKVTLYSNIKLNWTASRGQKIADYVYIKGQTGCVQSNCVQEVARFNICYDSIACIHNILTLKLPG